MQLAFVDGVAPINVERLCHKGCHLVDIVGVERDDAKSQQVCDVVNRFVLGPFAFQFAGQRSLLLDAVVDGRYLYVLVAEGILQALEYQCLQLGKQGQPLTELLEQ